MGISHGRRKSKGTTAERDLIKLFWENGWAAFRAAGSGSVPLPCPDIIAGTHNRKLAIEVKVVDAKRKYLSSDEIKDLACFSEKFGAEGWVGVKFNRVGWTFVPLTQLERTASQFVVSPLQDRGLAFLLGDSANILATSTK